MIRIKKSAYEKIKKIKKPFYSIYCHGSTLRIHHPNCREVKKNRIPNQPNIILSPDNLKSFMPNFIHLRRRLSDYWIEIFSGHPLGSKAIINEIKNNLEHYCQIKFCKHCF